MGDIDVRTDEFGFGNESTGLSVADAITQLENERLRRAEALGGKQRHHMGPQGRSRERHPRKGQAQQPERAVPNGFAHGGVVLRVGFGGKRGPHKLHCVRLGPRLDQPLRYTDLLEW